MTDEELKILEKLYNDEVKKRKEVLSLMEDSKVKRFLELTKRQDLAGPTAKSVYKLSDRDIFYKILQSEKRIVLSGSSEIYVEDSETTKPRTKTYSNLESYSVTEPGLTIRGSEIEDFEETHDILDSNNENFENDTITGAQAFFFQQAFYCGPEKAKELTLKRYGTLRNKKDQDDK